MNNKRMHAFFAALCAAFMTSAVHAAKGFDYSYGEFGYQRIDSDSIEGNGFLAGFSFGATDLIHIEGEYSRSFIDDADGTSDADLDADVFKIGGGAHFSLTDNLDVLGTVRWTDLELTGDVTLEGDNFKTNINEDIEGWEYEAGVRFQATKALELTGRVVFLDTDDDEDTGFGAGLVWKLDKNFSVRLRGDYFEDDSELNLLAGVRLRFR